MNGKKILIVDDNGVVLRALSIKLSTRGYVVLTAEDGAGAVRAARQGKPDLIVLDIHFPPDVAGVPWDGVRIMKWLKHMEASRRIPVIVITGSKDAAIKARALAAGAVEFFQKPVDTEALLAVIRKTLEEKPEASQPAV